MTPVKRTSFYDQLKLNERSIIWTAILIFAFQLNLYSLSAKSTDSEFLMVDTIACDPGFYQTIGSDGTLVRYEYDGFELGFEIIAVFGFQVNATSFNILDGYMYCIAQGSQDLIRFDTDGNYTNLGPLPIFGSIYVGGFDTKGNYYVCQGGANEVFKINVATLTVETLTISTNLKFRAADWAYVESQDRFYGVGGDQLYEFNPNDNSVNAYLLTGLESETNGFGGAFSTLNGGVFVSNNVSGNVFYIDIISLQALPIIGGPSSGINDGSSCPCALPPFPAIIPANDTLCISEGVSYNILTNDLVSFEEIDNGSFEVIFPPLFGDLSYNQQDGTITYQSDDPSVQDFFIYEICLDYELNICAQAIVVFLPDIYTTFEESICQGDTLVFNGEEFTEEGFYEFNHPAFNGCDSIVQLALNLNQPTSFELEAQICEQDSFEFNGVYYTEDGHYEFIELADNGCDSIVTFSLSVNSNFENTVNGSICAGEAFVYDGISYDVPGSYTQDLQTEFGCDSIIYIEVSLKEETSEEIAANICAGDSYELNGSIYTEEGSYVQILSGGNGCDSTLTFTLNLDPIFETTRVEEICEGTSYVLDNGSSYSETGIYEINYTATNGCDSLLTLNVLVKENFETNLQEEICEGEEIVLPDGSVFSQENIYELNYEAANGCDSLVTLDLTVKNHTEEILDEFICMGEAFSIGNSIYESTGNYTDLFTASNGCDSTVYLNLIVGEHSYITLEQNICEGESYTFNENELTNTGLYEQQEVASNGCDSIVNLFLTVLQNENSFLDVSICEGESYSLGTATYSEEGNYSEMFVASNGCDSLVELTLSIAPNFTEVKNESICQGEVYEINNMTFTETGYYEIFIEGNNSCDSIIYLDLVMNSNESFSFTENICEGESFVWDNSFITESGFYEKEYQTVNGCDSLVTLEVIQDPVYSEFIGQEICLGEEFMLAGQLYSEVGVYEINLLTQKGCDSLITLDLVVNEPATTNLKEVVCEGTEVEFGGIIYSDAGVYSRQLQTSKGCDSLVLLDLTVNPIYAFNYAEDLCEGETYTLNGQDFSETGLYEIDLTTIDGCDSILVLELNVKPIKETFLNEVVCIGSSFVVGDSIYSEAGIYQNIFQASNACDSIVTLNLSVEQVFTTTINQSICEGGIFNLLGEDYVEEGLYEILIQASNGCDSLITLNLIVNEPSNTQFERTICQGEVYLFGGEAYTETGNYSQTLANINSCDSTVELSLIVDEVFETMLFPEICEGETFEVAGDFYSETGEYENVLNAINGCDSIVFTSIIVYPVPITNLEAYSCFEDELGTVSNIYTSINGCDSTVNTTTYLLPPDECYLVADVVGETIDCGIDEGTFVFNLTVGTPPFNLAWSGTSSGSVEITTLGSYVLTELTIGFYEFEIMDANGNSTMLDGEILQHQTPEVFAQVALAFGEYDVSCHGETDGSALAFAEGGEPPYTFLWSTGSTGPEVLNLAAGEYTVTLIDANNCESITNVIITAPPPLDLSLDIFEIECFDPNSGSIILDANGGVPPYFYSINEEPLQLSNAFDLLSGGTYNFSVFDANDCLIEDVVTLTAPLAIDVELGEDIFINLGEGADLLANLNLPSSELDSVIWSENLPTDCETCLNQVVYPLETTTYTIYVDDINGCLDTDEITIHVDRDQSVYIPNAFTPNNDGINDVFMIFGNESAPPKVNSFHIYDRWGNKIYEANDFLANDPTNGWDGTFRGELHNPGVFVYYAIIEFFDGTEVLYEGDVTLLY